MRRNRDFNIHSILPCFFLSFQETVSQNIKYIYLDKVYSHTNISHFTTLVLTRHGYDHFFFWWERKDKSTFIWQNSFSKFFSIISEILVQSALNWHLDAYTEFYGLQHLIWFCNHCCWPRNVCLCDFLWNVQIALSRP